MDIDYSSKFWSYLSQNQKDLIIEGEYLMNEIIKHNAYSFKDYSFLIFPYAKAYEGYLKKLFLDLKFISHLDYISNHLRLGKLLSPYLISRLGQRSLYRKIEDKSGTELAERIWITWKSGRNQIFHYYPHNIKKVSFEESKKIVGEIIATMQEAFAKLK